MLTSLTIQNYALIQELNIDFSGGLSIITGETGAGKSILLGALSLLIGQRADTSVLLDHTRKCVVEGSFSIQSYGLEDQFRQLDLDYAEHTVIRREINPDGKSRAFVNDSPVNLSTLKELGEKLIDIHSQHQNLYLENPLFQLQVLDTFGRQNGLIHTYQELYDEHKRLQDAYRRIEDESLKNKADLDYFRHQFDQLNEVKLEEDEQESLETEFKTLSHAEEIKTALLSVTGLLSGEGNSVLIQLKDVVNCLGKLRNLYDPSEELQNRADNVLLEIKDLARETDALGSRIEHDPERIEFVKQRLDTIYALQQKHRVNSIKELLALRDELQKKIDDISNSDLKLDELRVALTKIRSQLGNTAAELTRQRTRVIPGIEQRIHELLVQLGIHNARFKIDLQATDDFMPSGKDKISFLFSANKQVPLQLLSKVASGGEMARLMLSIKAVISEEIALPTIIFDEIDAGVSGDVADKVGNVMVAMSDHAQIINITHLPQIASKGRHHFFVFKNDLGKTTETQIRQLGSEERVIEIARMLSGEELSQAAINNAKALLGLN